MVGNTKNIIQPKDQLDLEVDDMLERAKDERFIAGIYNFCDRWCERCPDTDKCFLFSNEVQSEAKKVINGQNDESLDGAMAEVHHSFEITGRLLERMMREQGMDYDKIVKEAENITEWDDDAHQRYNQIASVKLANIYLDQVHEFLKNFHEKRLKYFSQTGLEIDYSAIKNEMEIITWYHTMVPVKIWRYYYEKESLAKEQDSELKIMMAEDLDKFYALVDKCLNQSRLAWENLAKKRDDLAGDCQNFIKMLIEINDEFKKDNSLN